MYRIQEVDKRRIKGHIGSKIRKEDCDIGFDIFVEIVNMPMNEVIFKEELAKKLVNYDPYDESSNIQDLMCIKDFLDKLYLIINKSNSVDIFEKQIERAINNPSYSYYNEEYITILDMYRQNSINSDSGTSTLDVNEGERIMECVWRVIIHQCLIYKDEINRETELRKQEVLDLDFVSYAVEKIKDIDAEDKELFAKRYYNLTWDKIRTGKNSSKKYIGAPGSGKTTKMKKEYLLMLESVKEGTLEILPVWIDLKSFRPSEAGEYDLIGKIETVIGKKDIYNAILEKGKIVLFLDGYNEILLTGNDKAGEKKKVLASKINNLHRKYPEIEINMTDRVEKSRVKCLTDNVDVLQCKGVDMEVIEEYCKQQGADDEIIEQIKNIGWLKVEKNPLTPYQVNILIDIVKEKLNNSDTYEPPSKESFIRDFLDKLIEREGNENEEIEIDIFNAMMTYVANNIFNHKDDGIEFLYLLDKMGEKLKNFETNPIRMYDLAIELKILRYDEPYVYFEEVYYDRYRRI